MDAGLEENREPTIFNSLLGRFFVGIFLFIALLYRQNELCLLSSLVLIVMTAAKIWTRMGHNRVTVTIDVDKQRAFPGERLSLVTVVENAKLLPVRIRIFWSLNSALNSVGGDEQTLRQEAGLLWYQNVRLLSDIVARHRGVYQIGPSFMRAGDFFGFFEKDKRSHETIRIIVYPRLVRLKTIPLPMRELFGVPGAVSPVKDPVYILGTQDYQPCRPSRHIHWKASARHLKLQEKVFEPSEQAKVLLAMEVGSFEKNTAKEAFEATLEIIASLALQLHHMGCAVGLAANGIMTGGGSAALPASRTPGKLPAILEVLARMKITQDGALKPILHQTLGSRRGFSCVYFSYEAGQAAAEIQEYCCRCNISMTFIVCLPDLVSAAIQQESRDGVYTIDEIRIQGSVTV